ncbi:type IV toxin-antitoxin system AbiEi family antitoxin domain-containing protein [Fibrobacter sp.]|uniref:type IV toxin-antitoxin system AbiEi family antitoxin domain-containing protein n=1 Tax=Fibrobacter sp. TaxID=35828 RepID=UPI0025C2CEFA|nr:type IV toxin-antitoxin system AbiEi family antitoxin domain-containing protein [Fibrobacter sp.]MBR3070682.1 type IV toxin-antitoxin system AbiEi family antitoxin domain-containing protein [Fibrobacter sp.]
MMNIEMFYALAFSTILLYIWFKMQVTNEQKLKKILDANIGYITRQQVDEQGIPSWFLTDFVRKNGLVKIDKGFYAQDDWLRDDFLVFQYKYPKFIFSFVSALFLHGLTDRLPESFEVTGPKNYRPFVPDGSVVIHTDTRGTYDLGVVDVKTSLGHVVHSYDREKTLCDIIRNSHKIDSEIYTKALRLYAKSKKKNVGNLIHYAQTMKIEKKVSEIMLVVLNED